MSIGHLELPNPVILAPMAGVTDLVTRRIAKEMGAALTVTEMVNDMGLIYAQQKTLRLAELDETGLRSIQIFGSKPEPMREASAKLEEYHPDLIDINMGCPMRKIVANGGGAALMLDIPRAVSIVKAVSSATATPITVKIRSGWDEAHLNAIDFALAMEDAGASALTIHARTREQFYSGKADWDIIRRVKERLSIPLIGNGDIWHPEDALRMIRETGCDAVMIGRGALGNPWIIQRSVALISYGEYLPPPEPRAKIAMAIRHLQDLIAYKGERIAVREMRKYCAWYLKGLPSASALRVLINREVQADRLRKLLEDYLARIEADLKATGDTKSSF